MSNVEIRPQIRRGISTGSIYEDLVRLLPRTEGVNVNSTAEATGYCKSLAKHIVHYKERPGLFRVFESKNHLSSNTEADYNVYGLSYERLQHIYENHGPNKNLLLFGRFPYDTVFNQGDNIVELIKKAISDQSGKALKGYVDAYPQDTTFERFDKDYIWRDNSNSLTSTTSSYQVRTNKKINYRIQTCFPLSPHAPSKDILRH